MVKAALVLPNQLFADHPALQDPVRDVVLFEDPLFFGDPQYPARMHRQKLWLHRASMAHYQQALVKQGLNAKIIPYDPQNGACKRLFQNLKEQGITTVVMADPVDFIAEQRIHESADATGIKLEVLPSPGFLNSPDDNLKWYRGRKRWLMAEFYKGQRRRLDVLMENDKPLAGKWSLDTENRKKVPKALLKNLPLIEWPVHDEIDAVAKARVLSEFPHSIGSLEQLYYPTTQASAVAWFDQFLRQRFDRFGDFEDAIVAGESWLWHAMLTPVLNIGLLTPRQVLDTTLAYAERKDIPLNSLEGFLRQIIGWREFMRATYEDLGVTMRQTNHWGHHRPMPKSFYSGTTGIAPLDDTIQRVLATGYCHHIERLMVLGGFMFLCEIDPDAVYRWFMEMFVDSYDWVMVPNVYAMSQHADGGLITTKPYFSGSNYIRKMSHWDKGPWAEVWDGLYWRFIFKHSGALATNPRWAMMCRTAARIKPESKNHHLTIAEDFLEHLS